MSEDSNVYDGPTIVVTTDDGTFFSCAPFELDGVHVPPQGCWKFIDACGLEYIGPPYARQVGAP
jgi:hypothetical protein